MTRFRKRLVIGLAACATLGAVGLNVVAYNQAYTMTHFSPGGARTLKEEKLSGWKKLKTLFCGVNIPRPRSTDSPASIAPNCISVRIPCRDGPTLGAWYCPSAEGSNCLVILFHGYTAEKSSLSGEARAFLEKGCSVLLVDFRGSGESSESYTTIGYLEGRDVEAAANYAREHFPHRRVVLYGVSMGAASILRAVADEGVRPDAIILESVFDRLLETVRNRFHIMKLPSFPAAELLVFWGGRQTGFDGFAHNPVDYARKVRCPILFFHGGEDPRARVEEARAVFDAIPGVKEFREIPHAAHQSVLAADPATWHTAIKPFLEGTP